MIKYYYLLVLSLFMAGCSLTDSDQPIPSYLVINEVNVSTLPVQGEATHNISDLWVYADNELIGVFAIPARIPILVNGETTEFQIFPGIRNNGEFSRSFIYLLMNSEKFTVPLAPGEEIEKSFNFTYTDNAIFDFVEGFESSGHIFSLDLDENPETYIDVTDETAVAGSKSGKISLDNTNTEIAVATIFNYEGSQNAGRDSYLEMDYKCDMPFFVGVIYIEGGQEITQPLIVINPTDDWNKIYIDFTDVLTSPEIESYRVYITTDLEPLDQETGEIFLDNLKFVHL